MTVGDIDGNADKIVAWTRNAVERGAHVVAFPELGLTGYPVEDLALRASFVDASQARIHDLAQRLADEGLGDIVVVCGYLDRAGGTAMGIDRLGRPKGSPTNSAAVIHQGRVVTSAVKHHLPNYGVFDEFRHFVPGNTLQVIRIHGIDVALVICEDLWQDGGPVAVTKAAGAGLLLVVNSSPYEANKDDVRGDLVRRRAREAGCSLAYVNLVGGQDELVFDGDSLIADAEGSVFARAPQFEQGSMVVDLDLPAASGTPSGTHEGIEIVHTVLHEDALEPYEPMDSAVAPRLSDEAEMYGAIVTGLRDYVQKNGFKSVLLGLSGGIDSSLVAAIACDAIGPEHVFGISNPSVYSSDHSKDDAADLAARTGLNYRVVPIQPMVQPFLDTLGLTGLAEENLQARVRGGRLDGPVERRRPPCACLRQQIRAVRRLLDHLRRRGRRLRTAQGRPEDAGLAAGEVAEPGRDRPRPAAADPGELDRQAAVGRVAPGTAGHRLTAAVRSARRHAGRLRRAGPRQCRAGRRRVRHRAGHEGDPAGRPGGVQAPAVSTGPEDHPQGFRPGPATADHERMA